MSFLSSSVSDWVDLCRKSDWTRNEEIQKKHNFLAIKALVVLQKFFLCRWHCIDSMRFMVPSIWTASNWTGWNTAPNLYRVESELLKVHEGFVEFLLFHKWKCHFVKPWAASSCSFQFFMFCFFFYLLSFPRFFGRFNLWFTGFLTRLLQTVDGLAVRSDTALRSCATFFGILVSSEPRCNIF